MLRSLVAPLEAMFPSLGSAGVLAVLVALVVIAATTVLLGCKRTVGAIVTPSGNTVLVVGPMGTGKTTLFHRLVSGRLVQTVTSQEPNVAAAYDIKGASNARVQLVDTPGHDSVWPDTRDRLAGARGVVFLVDSRKPDPKECAKKLFELLSDPAAKAKRTPFLVACNKSELAGAQELKKIETDLAEELQFFEEAADDIEDTEGNTIERSLFSSGASGDADFTFADSPCRVEFAKVSVKEGRLDPLYDFLKRIA